MAGARWVAHPACTTSKAPPPWPPTPPHLLLPDDRYLPPQHSRAAGGTQEQGRLRGGAADGAPLADAAACGRAQLGQRRVDARLQGLQGGRARMGVWVAGAPVARSSESGALMRACMLRSTRGTRAEGTEGGVGFSSKGGVQRWVRSPVSKQKGFWQAVSRPRAGAHSTVPARPARTPTQASPAHPSPTHLRNRPRSLGRHAQP